MAKFSYKEIDSIQKDQLFNESCIIWVLHANKIPPHVGISQNNLFYSLKARGKDDGLPCQTILKIAKKKQIAVLFYDIRTYGALNIKIEYDKYKNIIIGKSTCLTPLSNLLLNQNNELLLHQLLEKLRSTNRIKQIFGLNLGNDFNGIPSYSKSEVEQRIIDIQHVKGRQNFSKSD